MRPPIEEQVRWYPEELALLRMVYGKARGARRLRLQGMIADAQRSEREVDYLLRHDAYRIAADRRRHAHVNPLGIVLAAEAVEQAATEGLHWNEALESTRELAVGGDS